MGILFTLDFYCIPILIFVLVSDIVTNLSVLLQLHTFFMQTVNEISMRRATEKLMKCGWFHFYCSRKAKVCYSNQIPPIQQLLYCIWFWKYINK